MIRPRHLSDEMKKNFRHWAMELVVVVVGVLLALWAQQWDEQRREVRQHAESLEALDREILIMLAAAMRPVAVDACVVAQFDQLREMLEVDSGSWPGLVARGRIEREGRMEGPINFPTNSYSEEAVSHARETGALQALPSDTATAYEEVFYILRRLSGVHNEMKQVLAHLRPLSRPRPLDAAARLDMLEQLALFDQIRATHLYVAEYMAEQANIIGLKAEDVAAVHLELDDLRKAYGDCVRDVDLRTGKALPR